MNDHISDPKNPDKSNLRSEEKTENQYEGGRM